MAAVIGLGPVVVVILILFARFGIAETRLSRAISRERGSGPDLASVDSVSTFFRTGNARIAFREQAVRDIRSGVMGDAELRRLVAVRRRRFLEFAIGAPLCFLVSIPWFYAVDSLLGSSNASSVGLVQLLAIVAFAGVGAACVYQAVRLRAAGQTQLAVVTLVGFLTVAVGLGFLLLRIR